MIKIKLDKEGQAFQVSMIDLTLRNSGVQNLEECHKLMTQINKELEKQKK